MKEALTAIFCYLFSHSIYQYALPITDIYNLPSRALLESLSFFLLLIECNKEYYDPKRGIGFGYDISLKSQRFRIWIMRANFTYFPY